MEGSLDGEKAAQAPGTSALSEEIASNVITVVQHYHGRREGLSYIVVEGPEETESLPTGDDRVTAVLRPDEAVVVGQASESAIWVRERVIVNKGGQAVDQRNTFLARRALKKSGIKPKRVLHTEIYE